MPRGRDGGLLKASAEGEGGGQERRASAECQCRALIALALFHRHGLPFRRVHSFRMAPTINPIISIKYSMSIQRKSGYFIA